VLGCDGVSDYRPHDVEGVALPIHTLTLVAMGIQLLDNQNLEAGSRAGLTENAVDGPRKKPSVVVRIDEDGELGRGHRGGLTGRPLAARPRIQSTARPPAAAIFVGPWVRANTTAAGGAGPRGPDRPLGALISIALHPASLASQFQASPTIQRCCGRKPRRRAAARWPAYPGDAPPAS